MATIRSIANNSSRFGSNLDRYQPFTGSDKRPDRFRPLSPPLGPTVNRPHSAQPAHRIPVPPPCCAWTPQERNKGRPPWYSRGGGGVGHPSLIHSLVRPCPSIGSGPSRPPFTSEVSARVGALLNSRIHVLRPVGPDPSAAEPGQATVGNRGASRHGRLGRRRGVFNRPNRSPEPCLVPQGQRRRS